jgi:hypothetical protein
MPRSSTGCRRRRRGATPGSISPIPTPTYVEAGCLLDGLSESFAYNFVPGGSIQVVDRSRVAPTSSGMTLTWDDNQFRRVDLTFQWVSEPSATA